MKFLRKSRFHFWGSLVFGSLMVLGVSLYLSVQLFIKKNAPLYEGKLTIKGLNSEVIVDYDKMGIPHIKAKTEDDAFLALGFVTAQDRLFQMDLLRRLGKGELAEIFGEKAIEADKTFRTLSLVSPLMKRLRPSENLNQAHNKAMKSFYQGVNQFIAEDNLPFEYDLLGIKPAPFSYSDAYSVLGYMAYSFAMGLKTDPLLTLIENKLGKEYANEMRRNPRAVLKDKARTGYIHSDLKEEIDFFNGVWKRGHNFVSNRIGLFSGSNAWALSAKRSSTGAPILASDPHVSFAIPGLWYEAHVQWEKGETRDNFEFYGHFVPGLPFPAMAHTNRHAWAVTISYIDDMDFITHKTNEKGDYLFNGNFQTAIKRTENIIVKDRDSIRFDVFESEDGPFVGPILLKSREGLSTEMVNHLKKQRVRLKWAHHSQNNFPAAAFYGVLTAKNKNEFEKSLSLGKSPGVNVVYIDKENNIARYLFGGLYKRPEEMRGDTLYSHDFEKGYKISEASFKEHPHLINPQSGMVVSANQKPEDTPKMAAGYFQPYDRHYTITSVLRNKEKWSLEELKTLQTSNINFFTPNYLGGLKAANDLINKKGQEMEKLTGKEGEALTYLLNWDTNSLKTSGESLLFYKWFYHLLMVTYKELGKEGILSYCQTNYWWHALGRNLSGVRRGFDDDHSFKNAQNIIKAFKFAVKELETNYGAKENWKLASEQTLTIAHPMSRASKMLASFLDIGPFPVDGGFNQVNNMRSVGCEDGLKVKAGPSTRRLVSLDKPEESFGSSPLGNSGHYGSPFFKNQKESFFNGGYRKQIMRSLEKNERYGRLTLVP